MSAARYFYDFEFIEDGKTIDPISIGVVNEDGRREFYAVFEEIGHEPLYRRIREHDWLMENVIPHLPLSTKPGSYRGKGYELPGPPNVSPRSPYGGFNLDYDSLLIRPRHIIRKELLAYLRGAGQPIELWGYYPAYDHVALAQLLAGPMSNLPAGIPMRTNCLQQELARRGLRDGEAKTRWPQQDEHHALGDARWIRTVWLDLADQNPADEMVP